METAVKLTDEVVALLSEANPCYLATVMPDGSPQLTETWGDTDGEHLLINTVRGHVKLRNIDRDPRVAVAVAHRDDPSLYYQIRGRVIATTEEGVVEHIESLAQRYLGGPYPWYGGRDQVRVLLTIEADRITGRG
jgi:PPOX class probable F420-dependent enzyme